MKPSDLGGKLARDSIIKCPYCSQTNEPETITCTRCGNTLSTTQNDVNLNGYSSARQVLPAVVTRGQSVEDNINDLLIQLGYVEGKDYERNEKIAYSTINAHASINEDFVFPNAKNPNIIIAATHSHPTIPGHSNENKLHQALGELWLLKTFNRNLKCIIFIGGDKSNWLPYVVPTMDLFYDGSVHSWDSNPLNSLKNAISSQNKHEQFWIDEKRFRDSNPLSTDNAVAPNARLRTNFFDNIIKPELGNLILTNINNSVLKKMIQLSSNTRDQNLLNYIKDGDANKAWEERTINNPPEIIFEMILEHHKMKFLSEIKDGNNALVVSPNLLYDLGYSNCHRRTDFLLDAQGKKVLIECKSAGGGAGGQLTKHITDRAREQLARSILHRCSYRDNELISGNKNFYWYYILDAKWNTPISYPLKYIHILQMCGIDNVFSCDDLVDANYEPNYNFKLIDELKRIGV